MWVAGFGNCAKLSLCGPVFSWHHLPPSGVSSADSALDLTHIRGWTYNHGLLRNQKTFLTQSISSEKAWSSTISSLFFWGYLTSSWFGILLEKGLLNIFFSGLESPWTGLWKVGEGNAEKMFYHVLGHMHIISQPLCTFLCSLHQIPYPWANPSGPFRNLASQTCLLPGVLERGREAPRKSLYPWRYTDPWGLGAGRGEPAVCVLAGAGWLPPARMDLLVPTGASLSLDQWNKPICAPTTFPPGWIQWALCKGIKALACSAGRRALCWSSVAVWPCVCVAMWAAVGPDSQVAGVVAGNRSRWWQPPQRGSVCAMCLCPLRAQRGVFLRRESREMRWRDLGPSRWEGGVSRRS